MQRVRVREGGRWHSGINWGPDSGGLIYAKGLEFDSEGSGETLKQRNDTRFVFKYATLATGEEWI